MCFTLWSINWFVCAIEECCISGINVYASLGWKERCFPTSYTISRNPLNPYKARPWWFFRKFEIYHGPGLTLMTVRQKRYFLACLCLKWRCLTYMRRVWNESMRPFTSCSRQIFQCHQTSLSLLTCICPCATINVISYILQKYFLNRRLAFLVMSVNYSVIKQSEKTWWTIYEKISKCDVMIPCSAYIWCSTWPWRCLKCTMSKW